MRDKERIYKCVQGIHGKDVPRSTVVRTVNRLTNELKGTR